MVNMSAARTPSSRPQHSRGAARRASSRRAAASTAGRSMRGLVTFTRAGEAGLDLSHQPAVLGIQDVDLLAMGLAHPQDQPPRLALHLHDPRPGRELEDARDAMAGGLAAQPGDAADDQ